MIQARDEAALHALADALADAAKIHSAAARVADDPALTDRLSARADRLDRLVMEVRDRSEAPDPGTALQWLDGLKLQVDAWLGDDNAAALAASREAKANLARFLDDQVRDPELSPPVAALFGAILAQISGGSQYRGAETGLKNLPS